MKLLQKVTLYFLNNEKAVKSLGFQQPGKFWVVLDTALIALTTQRKKKVEKSLELHENLANKNSYLGELFYWFSKTAQIDQIKVDKFKMAFFTTICKSVMKGMQERAVLSTQQNFFIDNELIKQWDLGSFALDAPKITKDILLYRRLGGYAIVLTVPFAGFVSFKEYYHIKYGHEAPTQPFGKVQHLSVIDIRSYEIRYENDMLFIGVVCSLITVVTLSGLLKRSNRNYINVAGIILMAAILFWLMAF